MRHTRRGEGSSLTLAVTVTVMGAAALAMIAAGVVSLTPQPARSAGEDSARAAQLSFAVTLEPTATAPATAPASAAATVSTQPTASPTLVAASSATTEAEDSPDEPTPEVPRRIIIPSIGLDAPIHPVALEHAENGRTAQWSVPAGRAAGWHNTSARLGEPGNLVLNGHHNINGKVFERLKDLEPYSRIIVIGDQQSTTYVVTERKLLLERGQPLSVRAQHAEWIAPKPDKRLTLVTCWPPDSDAYRLILVALPVSDAPHSRQ